VVELLTHKGKAGEGTPPLDKLLVRYWGSLVAYASRLLGDHQAAEDVVQRAFIRLWESKLPIPDEDAARALLYRAVRNLVFNEWRNERVRARWMSEQWVDEPENETPEIRFEHEEMQKAIEAAVEQLPPRRREVFVLSRYHGLSNDEIASVLGISIQTVANQLVSCLRTLRGSLAAHADRPMYPALKVIRQKKSQAG
jgi:RNA polymerase sigma-70 factor, ECF subfamily